MSSLLGCAQETSPEPPSDTSSADLSVEPSDAGDADTLTDSLSVTDSLSDDLGTPSEDVIELDVDELDVFQDVEADSTATDSLGDTLDTSDASEADVTADISEQEVSADAIDEVAEFDVVEDTGPLCQECMGSDVTATYALPKESFQTSLSRVRENVFRGFVTSYLWGPPANTLSDQMEFIYIPMSSVWNENGALLDTGLEPYLVEAEARGHHAIVRVYVDYPKKPSGMPAYLMDAVGCMPYQEHGGGCSPYYDHPLMVEAMVGLLEALGAAYDGDPRLGVLQIGLLGFWGEWHTYPHTDWFPNNATQEAVLNAAHDAFSITQLQVRRPAANSVGLRIGFHDDSFAHSTLGDVNWFFYPQLVAAGADKRWEEVMIGGELRPELQSTVFDEDYQLGTYAQDIEQCIETTHASYLLNFKGFSENGVGYVGAELEAAEEAALKMGYRFEVEGASLTLTNLHEGLVDAKVMVTFAQTGNAPFYYTLHPALEWAGLPGWVQSDDDLKTLLPGQTQDVVFDLGTVKLEALTQGIKIHLTSDMVLPNQTLNLATTTPWTKEGEPTSIAWSVGCVANGQAFLLGAAYGEDEAGCPCVCDVDGVMRHCGGEPCF